MTDHLRVEHRADDVVEVILDRPPTNAADPVLLAELTDTAYRCYDHPPRVVLLSSAHPVFMAGADFTALEFDTPFMAEFCSAFQRMTTAWARIPCPTVALIGGHALGGGAELAMACDWRLMARGRGRFGFPEVRRSALASAGGTQRVARLLGAARAKDLLMRGRLLDADQAEAIGLVSEACDPDELRGCGQALVDELLGLPRLALAASKRAVDEGLDGSFATGLAVELREVLELFRSADTQEGIRSFLEKREPVWTHR